MLRKLIACLIIVYALSFAFGALTAVRWPSIIIAMSWWANGTLDAGLQTVDWRQMGMAYGGLYLLAALCFYASAVMVAGRRSGAVGWYIMGLISGLPCVLLVEFAPNWWHDPSPTEGAMAGGCLAAALLLVAVWDLRKRTARPDMIPASGPQELETAGAPPKEPTLLDLIAATRAKPSKNAQNPDTSTPPRPPKPARRRPISPAIARQRASFAAHGRKPVRRRRIVWSR